ncbi:MAG TPA: hypothetical protein VFA24_01600 [Gaiellaceae bacterium]|nr:hypothetical protein [Gaiellaceae bacterium]
MRILVAAAFAAVVAAASASARTAADCAVTSVAMTPLTDLGPATYHGYRGGLYPGGRNAPGPRYLARGLAAARQVKPVGGKIVLLSIGMSNATQEFREFQRIARPAAGVLVVDGAIGGQDAEKIKDPSYRYWTAVDQRLAAAGATAAQVQAVWLKEAIARQSEPFPADAQRLRDDLRAIVRILGQRFPNLRLVYVSSRTYAGYATSPLNPEPQAYDSGFAVKWLVADAIDGRLTTRAWVGWGPYLWTNGTKGRADGLTWTCDDVRSTDGTHPSPSGRRKVAALLVRFFQTSPTTRSWFAGG